MKNFNRVKKKKNVKFRDNVKKLIHPSQFFKLNIQIYDILIDDMH